MCPDMLLLNLILFKYLFLSCFKSSTPGNSFVQFKLVSCDIFIHLCLNFIFIDSVSFEVLGAVGLIIIFWLSKENKMYIEHKGEQMACPDH